MAGANQAKVKEVGGGGGVTREKWSTLLQMSSFNLMNHDNPINV